MNNGNVGIGTTSPNSQFHLYQTSGNNAELDIQSVSGANQHWALYQDRTSGDFRFWNNNISGEKNLLTLGDNGAVGIGTSSPNARLAVVGINPASGSASPVMSLFGGKGANQNPGANGGGLDITLGNGGDSTTAGFPGGNGGSMNIILGTGGNALGSNYTGPGGGFTVVAGAAAGPISLTAGAGYSGNNPGAGGVVGLTGGKGGGSSVGSGQYGGSVYVTAGAGGWASYNSTGVGGSVYVLGGAPGENAGFATVAAPGDVNLAVTTGNVAQGKVGIRKNNPATALDVNGTVTASDYLVGLGGITNQNASYWDSIRMTSGGFMARTGGNDLYMMSNLYFDTAGWKYYLAASTAGAMFSLADGLNFYTVPAGTAGSVATLVQRLVINNAGNVGISCADPDHLLELGGTGTGCNIGTGSWIAAGSTAFTANSSRDWKENIATFDVPDILTRMQKVSPRTFDWKPEYDNGADRTNNLGFIAEEFYPVLERGDNKHVNGQDVMIANWLATQHLIQVVNEQQKQIDSLQAAIKSLKAKGR
jgi:hypothetical protein